MNGDDQRVLIVSNPMSGAAESGGKISHLYQAIKDCGFDCQVLQDLQQVEAASTQLMRAGKLRAVVSAGGDGTADALANILQPEIPILLFPLGTENLLAKFFQITADIKNACAILQHGQQIKMDVGSVNDQLFLVMASIGYDAQVVEEMHAIREGHISRWSYIKPIFRALRKYRFPQLPYRLDLNEQYSCDKGGELLLEERSGGVSPPPQTAAWIFVFNVPRYAAALDFCPQADPLDGQLDICTFKRSGISFGLGYLTRLFFRSHQSLRGFQHQRCRQILVESPRDAQGHIISRVPYQVDGDPGGQLPVRIKVLPRRLTLLTPHPANLAPIK